MSSPESTSSPKPGPARPRLSTVPSEASIDLTSPRIPSPLADAAPVTDHTHTPNRVVRMPSGLPSTRVGLGSPQIDFRPEWSRRDTAELPSSTEKKGKLNGLVDRISGLPSPPGTESDVALTQVAKVNDSQARPPLPIERTSSVRLVPRAAPATSVRPAPERTTTMSSSTSTPRNLSSSTSSISSSHRKSVRPRQSPGISRSSSSSSQLATKSALTARRLSAEVPQSRGLNGESPLLRGHSDHTSGSGSSRHSRSASASPAKASSEALPERGMSHRLSGSWENGMANHATITEEPRHSPVDDLDSRIQDAEEKLKSSVHRRPTLEDEDHRGTVRGQTYSRGSPGIASPTPLDSSTIRRSATVANHNGRPRYTETPIRDRFTEYQGMRSPEAIVTNGQQRSGGSSGSGKRKPLPAEFMSGPAFTPSPEIPYSPRSMRLQGQNYSQHMESPLASRYHTTSRLSREIDDVPSPSRSRMFPSPSKLDGLGVTHRRLNGASIDPGTSSPHRAEMRDRQRPASVMDTSFDRQRYISRTSAESADRGLSTRASRIGLAPSDSISVVGGRGMEAKDESKNPLDVIRRIEESRAQHNKQWEVDRAQSVLGDREPIPSSRPASRYGHDVTPQRVRPATSMSSLRHSAPRTAPVERYRRPFDENAEDGRLQYRASSRLSQVGGSSSEPRPMRSSTSLGGRSSAPLGIDVSTASTEHGRLLFEACQALASKLGPDIASILPDLMYSFGSATRSSEALNASVRTAVDLSTALSTAIELEDPTSFRENAMRLATVLRDASRTSDQEVRDLTRIMLDLPKLFRGDSGSRWTASTTTSSIRGNGVMSHDSEDLDCTKPIQEMSKRWRAGSPATSTSTPVRRSEEIFRSSTSMGDVYSPTGRFSRQQREYLSPALGTKGMAMANFVAKVRNLGSSSTPRRSGDEGLQTIEASPPTLYDPQEQPTPTPAASMPPPPSPRRPNVLKKKTSTASTNTVRGSSSFFPSKPKVRTTTAVSQVTAGGDEARSVRSSMEWDEVVPQSPASKFSFNSTSGAAAGGSGGGGLGSGGGGGGVSTESESSEDRRSSWEGEEAIRALAMAAKVREESQNIARRGSISERVRGVLRRG